MLNRFSISVLFIYGFSYGQLSVRNNTYVFVKDQIVFVKDAINLNEADSRIYLRNEAQIIQGTGTTGNSGIGELSVYQEGNVGEYEYNYWCSPIGSKTNNSVNNPFGISFLNEATGPTTSTPASFNHNSNFNGTSSPLNIEPYWIWKYIAGTDYFDWIHVEGNTAINPGEGFTMKGTIGSGDAQRYDFRGKPNTGTIGVSVLNNKLSLVGNPYPSAMDAAAYIHDSQNASVITGTLYYWEQNPAIDSHYLRDYEGGYATYTIDAAGVETFVPAVFNTFNGDGSINVSNTGTGSKTARRYIPIAQGFMVEGTATGTVKAKNSHRVYVKETAADSEFFKSSNSKEKSKINQSSIGFSVVPSDYKRFRINVDFNNTYTRQLVETFHAIATIGFDYGMESKINADDILKSDAFWSNNPDAFLAEALPFDENSTIPITIKVSQKMPIRVRIFDIQNFETVPAIYLHDVELNTYVDLKTQDFNINLATGNYTKRFEITFKNTTLDVEANVFEGIQVFQNNNASEVTIGNSNALVIKSLQLHDVTGKLVLQRNISSNEKVYAYSTKSLSDGIYIATLSLVTQQVFIKKISISNKK
ncbi:T9SS type A sorting domain-containing protein [Mariniflexile sp.]|uniref:T9SS type A sorting domain-containing protein n=1 Tax=Mariniflexile sp. TaxID=1979402 RepID=UPI004047BCEA